MTLYARCSGGCGPTERRKGTDKWNKSVPPAAEGGSKLSQSAVSNSTDDVASFDF